MWLFAFDDTNDSPNKRLDYLQVMEGDMTIPNELYDIVKERVMISRGTA